MQEAPPAVDYTQGQMQAEMHSSLHSGHIMYAQQQLLNMPLYCRTLTAIASSYF